MAAQYEPAQQADPFAVPDLEAPAPAAAASAPQETFVGKLKQVKHPFACFFHVIFKVIALTFFVMADLFTDSFIMVFIVCTIMLSMDFWVVKNVTGRLLVGLRWRNEIDEEGKSIWLYDSIPDRGVIDRTEATVFWGSLLAVPLFWLVLALLDILSFKFSWLIIACMALSLNGSNVYGYYKCRKAHYEKLDQSAASDPMTNLTQRMSSSIATSVGQAVISSAMSGNLSGGLQTMDL